MLFRFDELDRAFHWVNDLHRQLDHVLARGGLVDVPRADGLGFLATHETENDVFLRADLPGVKADDVELNLEGDVLTLTARRRVTVPEGFRTHLQERRPFEFTRALKLPAQVDPEKVKATFDAGVLTVRLGKRPAEKPRAISVRAI